MLAALICAAFVTAAEPVLIPLLRKAAVDVPNARSSHRVPTPRGGGPPIAAASCWRCGYELFSKNPRFRVEQLRRLAEDKVDAIDGAVRDLGYAPRSFADGIRAKARAMGLAA